MSELGLLILMLEVCQKNVRSMQEVCRKYAGSMPEVFHKLSVGIFKICIPRVFPKEYQSIIEFFIKYLKSSFNVLVYIGSVPYVYQKCTRSLPEVLTRKRQVGGELKNWIFPNFSLERQI